MDSIARHFHISFNSKDRKSPYKFQLVKNDFGLGNDLLLFFTIIKILLDDISFFIPFYYKQSFKYGRKNEDLRDLDRPLDFQSLKHYFYDYKNIDNEFVEILKANEEWINDICDKRKFLIHRFHDLSIHNDWWIHAYFAFFYTFNDVKCFIPNVLTYVSRMYYNFVKFTTNIEEHFKSICQKQFSEFEYFEEGYASSRGLDKTHLFFAGLGRLLENKILIRIHPVRRNKITKTLEYFMREEKVICNKCNISNCKIQPTIEDFVIISSHCDCGKSLPIPLRVEEKFYPHFMDQSQKQVIGQLVSYDLKIKILKFIQKRAQ
ncbi:MAG: hypothetical protein H8D56_25920 [Planctomycetes bacterium]|nr:hypothetical protein [Planctomycetota bacterium]